MPGGRDGLGPLPWRLQEPFERSQEPSREASRAAREPSRAAQEASRVVWATSTSRPRGLKTLPSDLCSRPGGLKTLPSGLCSRSGGPKSSQGAKGIQDASRAFPEPTEPWTNHLSTQASRAVRESFRAAQEVCFGPVGQQKQQRREAWCGAMSRY